VGVPVRRVNVNLPTSAPIEGVVKSFCVEVWNWDRFYARCELDAGDGHTRHRWTNRDERQGEDVIIEWESFVADELPDDHWDCTACGHKHFGKNQSNENPNHPQNGSCTAIELRDTFAGRQKVRCHCDRRRPNKA
jgi:hypothetical protein